MHIQREDDFRKIRKDMSDFQKWVGKTRVDEFACFANIIIPEKIFPKLKLLRINKSESQYHAQNVKKYLYGDDKSRSDKHTLIEVIMAECASVVNAHESIIDIMTGSMVVKIPRGEEKGIAVGDISFTGHGEKLSSITFARSNMMAVVRSVGNLNLDVKSFTETLDGFLITKYNGVKSKHAPKITAFTLSSQQATIGQDVKISFNAIDPRDKELMFKLFTTAGPISMSDSNFILNCKKPGNHNVELYVINEDSLASNLKLDLSVD